MLDAVLFELAIRPALIPPRFWRSHSAFASAFDSILAVPFLCSIWCLLMFWALVLALLFFVRPEALAFLQKQATCLPKVELCSFDLTTRTINQIYIAFVRIARLRCVLPFLPHSSSQIQHLFGLSRQKISRRALPDCPQSTNDKKY